MSMESGRVALVTGSTSGLGREMARRLATAGANVVVTGRDEGRGGEVVGEITAGGGEAVFVAHDLEGDDLTRLVEEAQSAFGREVDILINNGGVLMSTPTAEVDAGTIDRMFRVNVRSAFLLTGAESRRFTFAEGHVTSHGASLSAYSPKGLEGMRSWALSGSQLWCAAASPA
jgi:NAD(P)-dependent dehydrogenase (short-subunit alcohol dehydrogenase family)